MKKLLYLLLLTPIIFLTSCRKSSVTPEPEPIEETIVGVTWQLFNVGGGWFRLNDDYTYSTKDHLCDTFTTEGVWSLDADVIEHRYMIGAVEHVEIRTIIEYSDSLLKFQADTTPASVSYVWFEACVPEPIRGCMDSTSLNFNPNAQCPDTCTNAPIYGCMDTEACNYDAAANIDDGSCILTTGCMDVTALNYDATATCDDGSCISIGDTHQGGIIFYLDGNGGGLVAAPSDQGQAEWGCIGTLIGADSLAINFGFQNTFLIEAGCTTPGTAADICANLTLAGFTKWYLPSKDELHQMYLNIGQGNALGLGNVGSFSNWIYWSSTEAASDYAWTEIFDFGFQLDALKNGGYYVRAVRAF